MKMQQQVRLGTHGKHHRCAEAEGNEVVLMQQQALHPWVPSGMVTAVEELELGKVMPSHQQEASHVKNHLRWEGMEKESEGCV